MTDIIYGGNSDVGITKEQAIKRFNEYYEGRAKSSIGRFRAKLFDMMYQKKPSKTLELGKPESSKYMLDEGPRTFDIAEVDSFKEGDEFVVHGEDITDKYTSKGATYKKDHDQEDEDKIYGPRLSGDDGKLYSTHFREVYESRKSLEADEKGSLKENNLVDIYWNKYRQGGIERKNKKTSSKLKPFVFGSFLPGAPKCILNNITMEISYEDDDNSLSKEEYDIQIEFLLRIGLLENTEDDGLRLKKSMRNAKVIKITASVMDQSDDLYYRVNDGWALDEECNEESMNFYEFMTEALSYELEDIEDAEIYKCGDEPILVRSESELSTSSVEEIIDTDEYQRTNIFGKESEEYESEDSDDESGSGEEEEEEEDEEDEEEEEESVVSSITNATSLEEVDEEEDEGSLSGLSDFEYDEDGNLLESGDEDEESGDEDEDESDEIGLTRDQASVLSNLDPSMRDLPGMEEAMKDLDI